MHKVPKGKVQNWHFEKRAPFLIVFSCILCTAIPAFAEGFYLFGLIAFVLGGGGIGHIFNTYRKLEKSINRREQPLPTEVIKDFYKWEDGDNIKIPTNSIPRHKSIRGEFKGVKDDGSIVLEVEYSTDGPEEKMSGEKVPNPKIFELPPALFEQYRYENRSLKTRSRKKLENKSIQELKNSSLNEALKEVRSELQDQHEESLKKPVEPPDVVKPV